MEELIKYIVSYLAEEPDKIQIERNEENIKIIVPKSDIGKIIGRQGRIAKAIRTIIKSSAKDGEKINLDIIEQEA